MTLSQEAAKEVAICWSIMTTRLFFSSLLIGKSQKLLCGGAGKSKRSRFSGRTCGGADLRRPLVDEQVPGVVVSEQTPGVVVEENGEVAGERALQGDGRDANEDANEDEKFAEDSLSLLLASLEDVALPKPEPSSLPPMRP